MSEWRDISTAPKDGTEIDIWIVGGESVDPEAYKDVGWAHRLPVRR